jgi:dTDP-4-dehydrorhamnose 3,5-epimerase
MINGVEIKKLEKHCDDRGYFLEVLKHGETTFCDVKQTSYAETYPGVVKAFHWHKEQTDVWFPVKGELQVVLYDLREDSPTQRETQVVYAGESNPVMIYIPPGVAHGYRVLGDKNAGVFYHMSKAYDSKNPDEHRIPFDDPQIDFDWNTRNR